MLRFGLILFASGFTLLTPAVSQPAPCPCDCDGDGRVRISELIAAVSIALGNADPSACAEADSDGNGAVGVAELVRCVNASLAECVFPPTPTLPLPTPTANPENQMPPLGGAELLAWLEEGRYLDWHAEPAAHPSLGPHFGDVRTFINQALFSSLNALPPLGANLQGSAAVKELFGSTGSDVRGWSVSIKVDQDSQDGRGWYWYERFGSSVFADRMGATGCTGCHGRDSEVATSRDYVLTSFPLAACNPSDEGHSRCGTLLAPDLDCAYDGELHYSWRPESEEATLYLRRGGYFYLDRSYYYSNNPPGELSYEGDFWHRYCFSDFPKPVAGSLGLSQGDAVLSFVEYSDSGELAVTFTGRRRH